MLILGTKHKVYILPFKMKKVQERGKWEQNTIRLAKSDRITSTELSYASGEAFQKSWFEICKY